MIKSNLQFIMCILLLIYCSFKIGEFNEYDKQNIKWKTCYKKWYGLSYSKQQVRINKFYKHDLNKEYGFAHEYNHISAFGDYQMSKCMHDKPMFGDKNQ